VREWKQENASDLPNGTSIDDKEALILLGRADTNQSFMCASDPVVAQYYKEFFKHRPRNRVVFRLLELRQVHVDLTSRSCEPPAPEGQLEAWQQPSRLTAVEGLRFYYRELPKFRRAQYEIYRVRSEFLGEGAPANGMSILGVLFDDQRRAAVEKAALLEEQVRGMGQIAA
jgi:hypothetical protein